jgi:localization factor PodJL
LRVKQALLLPGTADAGASMRSGASLSMQDVRPEAIETAREAARRCGQSVGQWLNSAIVETAAELGVRVPCRDIRQPVLDRRDRSGGFTIIDEQLDVLANRLDRLAIASADGPIASTPEGALGCNGGGIAPSARLSESRSRTRDLPAEKQAILPPLADAIALLNARLEQPQGHSAPDRGPPVTPMEAPVVEPAHSVVHPLDRRFGLERAILESERQSAVDVTPAPANRREDEFDSSSAPAPLQASAVVDLSGLERQLRHITDQIETLRRTTSLEEAVAALRRELAAIGHTITDAVPRRTIEVLQGEFRALAALVASHSHHGPADAALDGAERGLAQIREALAALMPAESLGRFAEELRALSQKIDLLAPAAPDDATLHQIEAGVAELRGTIARVASSEALVALAVEVRDIGAKLEGFIAEFGGADPEIGHLLQRIEALAAAIDANTVDRAVPPQFESLLDKVANKLEAVPTAAETAGFENLENRIADLAQKLDASDGNLAAIERALADLMGQLNTVHTSAVEAAERAATDAARGIVDASTGADAAIDELKHDVAALRESQADADRRAQDALEAVHRTLARLLDRIGRIESDVHTQAQSQEAFGRANSSQAGPAPYRPAVTALAPLVRPLPPRDQAPINPDLPADHPLEPGSLAPRGSAVPPSTEPNAAPGTASGTGKTQLAAEPGGKADFIAAARRAAQAATCNAAIGAQHTNTEKSPGALLGAIGSAISKRRRQLLIGICAFLIVVGVLNFAVSFLTSSNHRHMEPPRRASNETAKPSRDHARPVNCGAAGNSSTPPANAASGQQRPHAEQLFHAPSSAGPAGRTPGGQVPAAARHKTASL